MTKGCSKMKQDHEKALRMCILGGGGYLGQCLTKELHQLGHFVVVLDLHFETHTHIGLDSSRLLQIKGSILNTEQLVMALRGCDACFHLAGYGICGGASLNRPMCMLVNYEGTKTIIEQCCQLGVPRLIYSSSVGVVFFDRDLYDADESTPYLKKFGNAYSESKYLAEVAVLEASASGSLSTCALRLRGIYGPGEVRSTQRCVNLFLSGIGNKFTFQKSFFSSSPPLTQYVSAENCTSALIAAESVLRRPNSPVRGQAYHIVDGGEPVHPFGFWYPLMKAVGVSTPKYAVPYWLAYFVAFLMELLYHLFGVEPLFTRFEANLLALNNTYSIEKARRDLGYAPRNNHDMSATAEFFGRQTLAAAAKKAGERNKKMGLANNWLWNWEMADLCGKGCVSQRLLMLLSFAALLSSVVVRLYFVV